MNRLLILIIFIFACSPSIPDVQIEIQNSIHQYNVHDWKKLSLREKIAQMIMIRVRGDYYNNKHWYKNSLKQWIGNDGIGGIIAFGGSIHGTYYNINEFQNWSKYPLLVAADYERGLGQWMNGATLFPSNMAVAATGDKALAYDQGMITALEASAIGVHITFSPVMDVNNNSENPIINFRSYSDSPNTVSTFGNEFIKGVQENNLIACVKHFPGHGNTSIDSHSSMPSILGSEQDIQSLEMIPFKHAIQNGVKMVMVGHIAMPGLDQSGRPATHSSYITTEILRNKLNFDGIIITDGMEMGGLTNAVWAGESAIRSVEAGVDILLLPIDVRQTIDSIEEAVIQGRLNEERINKSVEKIWKMKYDLGLFSKPSKLPFNELENVVGIPSHINKSSEIARKSITIVKDDPNQLPLKPELIDSLGHIILSLDDNASRYLKSLSNDIHRTHGHVKEIYVNNPLSKLGIKDIINQMEDIDQIIISLVVRIRMDKGIATIDESHSTLIKELYNINIPIIVSSFGSPYLSDYDNIPTYICAYGYGDVSVKAVANALWGRSNITGVLPVNLNLDYRRGHGVKKKARSISLKTSLDDNFDEAYAVIDSAIKNNIFPGAQIAIIKNNQLIVNKAFGRHTYDDNSPLVNKETIFDIASLTKVVATVPIVMKLISQKKISLDQTVEQFFPSFTGYEKEKVTLLHLLTHSSGIEGYIPFYLDDSINNRDDIINYILHSKLKYSPGTKTEYSDLGFILLTAIIEKVSRSSVDKLSQKWIYNPLGMKATQYTPLYSERNSIAPTEIDSSFRKILVHGLVHDENTYIMGGVSGHAGIFSNAKDLAKYAQLWINKGLWNGKRILDESLVMQFISKQNALFDTDFAIGWDTPSTSGKSIAGDYFSDSSIGHLGFTGTSMWIDLNRKIGIILLSNRVHPTRKGKVGSIEMYGIRREFYNHAMKILIEEN